MNGRSLLRCVGCIAVAVSCCGCTVGKQLIRTIRGEHNYQKSLKRVDRQVEDWAESCWDACVNAHAEWQNNEDCEEGFIAGFKDHVLMNVQNPPPLPPNKYLREDYLSVSGQLCVENWYRGYQWGIMQAESGGYRELVVLRSAPGTYPDAEPTRYTPGNYVEPNQPAEPLPPTPAEAAPVEQPKPVPPPPAAAPIPKAAREMPWQPIGATSDAESGVEHADQQAAWSPFEQTKTSAAATVEKEVVDKEGVDKEGEAETSWEAPVETETSTETPKVEVHEPQAWNPREETKSEEVQPAEHKDDSKVWSQLKAITPETSEPARVVQEPIPPAVIEMKATESTTPAPELKRSEVQREKSWITVAEPKRVVPTVVRESEPVDDSKMWSKLDVINSSSEPKVIPAPDEDKSWTSIEGTRPATVIAIQKKEEPKSWAPLATSAPAKAVPVEKSKPLDQWSPFESPESPSGAPAEDAEAAATWDDVEEAGDTAVRAEKSGKEHQWQPTGATTADLKTGVSPAIASKVPENSARLSLNDEFGLEAEEEEAGRTSLQGDEDWAGETESAR